MTKRILSTSAAAALLACVAVGCGGQTTQQLGGQPSPTLNSMDNDYFRKIAESNLTEIQSSQMALQNSGNDQVKAFAQMMINDHTSAGSQVAAVARAKGATLPTMLDDSHKDMVKALNGKSGTDFDKAYLDLQITAHQDTINFNRDEADNGGDAEIKSVAESLRPVLRSHLDAAKDLKQKMMS